MLQYSQAVLNAKLDAIEATIGASALLKFYSGAKPANCAAAATGVLLGSTALPANWLAAAAAGVKSMAGAWAGVFTAAGDVGYFRITDSTGANVGMQGTATATGGGGDMTLDNISAAAAQQWNCTGFALTSANA
jgi:hypothetical protein